MADTTGTLSFFQGLSGAGGVALGIFKWLFYFIPVVALGWLAFYWFRHNYPVRILDMRQRTLGEGINMKETADKGAIYMHRGVPYFHLMKNHRVKYLRVPMANEIGHDGRVYLLRLGVNSFRYAPRTVMIRKKNNEEQFSTDRTSQVMLIANPEYDPKKPLGNPHNKPFLEQPDDPKIKSFGEGEIRQVVDETHTEAFSENVKGITERVYSTKDWRPIALYLGGFIVLGMCFIFLLIFAGRI